MSAWSRLARAVSFFPRRWKKADEARRRSYEDFSRCPFCGRFMNQEYGMTVRNRIVFEDKVYTSHYADVYSKKYAGEIHWAPHLIMHPRWVFWCKHCGYIVILPDLGDK